MKKLIILEGPDSIGKSTVADMLNQYLGDSAELLAQPSGSVYY